MAAYICCYSGLEIRTNHFPLYLSSRDGHTACHPIFHATQKSLLSYARKWSAHELTETDNYLLYLALMKSTGLMYFRCPAQMISSEKLLTECGAEYTNLGTRSIVSANMEKLMYAIGRINLLSIPSVRFPEVVITPENCTLWNSKHWIDNWNQVYTDHLEGAARQERFADLSRRELALQKLIRTPHRNIASYADDLAEWADEVAAFPTFLVTAPGPVNGSEAGPPRQIPLNEYYKGIIIRAAAKEFFKINKADLSELIEYCEDRIAFSITKGENAGGSIQSYTLFRVLKEAKAYLASFIGNGTVSVVPIKISERWKFVEDDSNGEEDEPEEFAPGLNALIDDTPLDPPNPAAFAKRIDYIKAKIKWSVADAARKKVSDSGNNGLSNDSLGF